jgi:hypothetical protein
MEIEDAIKYSVAVLLALSFISCSKPETPATPTSKSAQTIDAEANIVNPASDTAQATEAISSIGFASPVHASEAKPAEPARK